jgi:Kdo2-lipid IVA lauroyltransferase/acyltransferase
MTNVLTAKDKIILFPVWILTLFPLRVLYCFSDILFFFLFYAIRYRRNIVFENLSKSFSDKDAKEIKEIAIKFYHYLCDYFIECLYMINMSEEECDKRFVYKNLDYLDKIYNQGNSMIWATSHYGNWEWIAALRKFQHFVPYGVYKPLSNKVFNRLFIYIREKYGGITIPMKNTLRVLVDAKKRNELFSIYLVGDQRPSVDDLTYWTTFLNQDTPIITGIEKLAKKFNLTVAYINVERVKRGYYQATFYEICNEPSKAKPNEITEKYIRIVEETIRRKPEFWLWSHNRWKYHPVQYKPKVS